MAVPACPLCGWQPSSLEDRCARCGGDLRPLRAVAELGDRHFNQAVTLARRGRWREAAEKLSVTLALAPDDVEALLLLGKVRLRQRSGAKAVAALERARELAPPGSASEATAIALLAATSQGAGQRRARPRPARREGSKPPGRKQRRGDP